MTPDDEPFAGRSILDLEADDEEAVIAEQEKVARLANPGWEIWPVKTYTNGWQWQAIPPMGLLDEYMELAGEKDSAHWPVFGQIPPGGHLLGFGSVGELQEAMDEVKDRAANPPAWRSTARSGGLLERIPAALALLDASRSAAGMPGCSA